MMRLLLVSLLLLPLLASSNPAAAESLRSGCYACHSESKIKSDAFLHGPVNIDACETCHTPHNGKTRTALRAQGKELCFSCHADTDFRGRVAHAPVKDGCVGCHSPHGGKTYSLLATSANELCQTCHSTAKQRTAHRGGDCTGCHDPHSSKRDHLLKPKLAKGICQRTGNLSRAKQIAAR